jgi:hypothetical protein
MAWDLAGNGKSVIKTTYGWYNYRVSAAGFVSVFNKVRPQANTYRWTDADKNNDYTPGEVDLRVVGGTDFITTSGGNTNLTNLDLEQPHTHEITASFERELAPETSIRALYVFRKTANDWEAVNPLRPYSVYNVPITRTDPGPDGSVTATADNVGPVTFYDFDPALRPLVAAQYHTRDTDDHFNTAEIAFTKRRSDRWSVTTSFAVTKNHRWVDAIAESPNDLYFPIDETYEWSAKIAGTYQMPFKIEASALFDAFSGLPGQRTYVFAAADPEGKPGQNLRGFGTVNLRLEPFGERKGPQRNNLNLRAARSIALAHSQAIRLELDVLNTLNTNVPWGNPGAGTPALGIIFASGPNFGYAQQIVAPRIFRVGVTYQF